MAKRALGRGIDALIGGSSRSADEPPARTRPDDGLIDLPVDRITFNELQPRKRFDQATIAELAQSIEHHGVLQPLIVERVGDDRYRIVAGERRFRAARLAGVERVPVLVREQSDLSRLETALIENIQREDLNALEEATAYRQLMETGSLTQDDVAKRLGKARTTVANTLRLLNLPLPMQEAIGDGSLHAGHARALLAVTDSERQQQLFQRAVNEGLSVREVERLAREDHDETSDGKTGDGNARDRTNRRSRSDDAGHPNAEAAQLSSIEQRLIDRFGTKVAIAGSGSQGTVTISYYSADDLNRLLDLFGGEDEEGP